MGRRDADARGRHQPAGGGAQPQPAFLNFCAMPDGRRGLRVKWPAWPGEQALPAGTFVGVALPGGEQDAGLVGVEGGGAGGVARARRCAGSPHTARVIINRDRQAHLGGGYLLVTVPEFPIAKTSCQD
jgi:hypothetical protein